MNNAAITAEAAERERVCPIPVSGLSGAIDDLRDHDDAAALPTLRAVRAGDEWERLAADERAVVVEWMLYRLRATPWKAAVHQTFGSRARDGRWRDAPLPAESGVMDEAPRFRPFSDLGECPADAPEVAPGLAYAGRAVLVHGIAGSGKTTAVAWAVARASVSGRKVLVLTSDDPASWHRLLVQLGARLDTVFAASASDLARSGALEDAVDDSEADWVVVDNWRTWGVASGIPDRGGFGNSEAAAVPVERLVALTRTGDRAVTIIHNEAKHRPGQARDSAVLIDAVDSTRCVTREPDGVTTCIEESPLDGKTRLGIPRAAVRMRWRPDGSGFDVLTGLGRTPSPASGGVQGGGVNGSGAVHASGGSHDSPLLRFAIQWATEHPQGSHRAFKAAYRAKGKRARNDALTTALQQAKVRLAGGAFPASDPPPRGTRERVFPESVPTPVPIDGNAFPEAFPTIGGTPVGERGESGERGTLPEQQQPAAAAPTTPGKRAEGTSGDGVEKGDLLPFPARGSAADAGDGEARTPDDAPAEQGQVVDVLTGRVLVANEDYYDYQMDGGGVRRFHLSCYRVPPPQGDGNTAQACESLMEDVSAYECRENFLIARDPKESNERRQAAAHALRNAQGFAEPPVGVAFGGRLERRPPPSRSGSL